MIILLVIRISHYIHGLNPGSPDKLCVYRIMCRFQLLLLRLCHSTDQEARQLFLRELHALLYQHHVRLCASADIVHVGRDSILVGTLRYFICTDVDLLVDSIEPCAYVTF